MDTPASSSLPPLDALLHALREAAGVRVAAGSALAERVRGALDDYDEASRAAAEAAIADRAAAGAGLAGVGVPDIAAERVELVTAMRELLAHLEHESADPRAPSADGGAVELPSTPSVSPEDSSEEESADDAAAAEGEDSADLEPASSGRPLTAEELRSWLASHAEEAPAPAPPPSRTAGTRRLRTLLDRAGEPRKLASDLETIDELEALEAVTAGGEVQGWHELAPEPQRLWLAFLVARARALKDRVGVDPARRQRVRAMIVRLPAFAARARPGHVNGMRPEHSPSSGTWTRDAELLLQELRALAQPAAGAVPPPSKRREPPSRGGDTTTATEWPLAHRVAGMRVVMFGGAPREDARVGLERALGIGSLEWPECGKPRRVDALAARLAAGKVDLLIVNRYITHKDATKIIDAARATKTPFAIADCGYGVEAVRQAIKDALDPEPHRSAPASR